MGGEEWCGGRGGWWRTWEGEGEVVEVGGEGRRVGGVCDGREETKLNKFSSY